MKHNFAGLKVSAVLALTLFVSACSTTEITDVWVNQAQVRSVKNVLVVGISQDAIKRRLYEDTFVQLLQKKGVVASPGYKMHGMEELPDTNSVMANIESTQADAVLVTHALGISNEEVYHPPRMEAVPHRYYDSFRGYYRTVYDYVRVPGYITSHVVVRLETNLYDSHSDALLWSAQSKSVDPTSYEKLISELANDVISSLEKAGFLGNPG